MDSAVAGRRGKGEREARREKWEALGTSEAAKLGTLQSAAPNCRPLWSLVS